MQLPAKKTLDPRLDDAKSAAVIDAYIDLRSDAAIFVRSGMPCVARRVARSARQMVAAFGVTSEEAVARAGAR